MKNRAIVIYCGLLLTLSAFSVDIILPAFSAISTDLSAPYTSVQLTVPVFIIAIGVGQFFVGSLSDKYGRRATILWGLAVFILGSTICVFAESIELLLAGRVLQGLGNSTAPVVSRAILRDMFHGSELARNFALATAVFAIGPIIAPLVGAAFMLVFPWPVLFVLMILFGAGLFVVGLFWLPETLVSRNLEAMRPATFLRNTKTVFINSISRFYLLLSGMVMSLMMLILTVSPRVYDENFGVTGTMFAILFAIHGFGIIVGQFTNRRLITLFGVYRSALIGSLVLIAACTLMLGISLAGFMTAYIFAGLFLLFATSYLVVLANATALTLNQHGAIAGFASSLFGFFSQVVGSVIVIIAQYFIGGSLLGFCGMLLAICCLIFAGLSTRYHADKND